MHVVLEYAKKRNLSLEFVVDDSNQWGKVYSNWTGVGVGGNLISDQTDVGFGKLKLHLTSANLLDNIVHTIL